MSVKRRVLSIRLRYKTIAQCYDLAEKSLKSTRAHHMATVVAMVLESCMDLLASNNMIPSYPNDDEAIKRLEKSLPKEEWVGFESLGSEVVNIFTKAVEQAASQPPPSEEHPATTQPASIEKQDVTTQPTLVEEQPTTAEKQPTPTEEQLPDFKSELIAERSRKRSLLAALEEKVEAIRRQEELNLLNSIMLNEQVATTGVAHRRAVSSKPPWEVPMLDEKDIPEDDPLWQAAKKTGDKLAELAVRAVYYSVSRQSWGSKEIANLCRQVFLEYKRYKGGTESETIQTHQ